MLFLALPAVRKQNYRKKNLKIGRNLPVNWLDAYQLEDEDDALQKALSLSQVTCLESICQSILIVPCGQIFISSLIFQNIYYEMYCNNIQGVPKKNGTRIN